MNIQCDSCKEIKDEKKFFHRQDRTICSICKDCLTKDINVYDENTFLWALKELDRPYFKSIWAQNIRATLDRSKEPVGRSIFGKYVAKMALCTFKLFTFKDSKEYSDNFDWHEGDSEKSIRELVEAYM